MKNYKGYYIDKVIFNNEEEIDSFLEKQAVNAYIMACELFARDCSMANSLYQDEKAEVLINQFGYTWEQLEEIEIQAYKKLHKTKK